MKTKKKRIFSQKHYTSGDGMLTTSWGPAAWHFLHTISFNYPVEPSEMDKKHYKHFLLSLQYVLPCKYCRENLKKNFQLLPITPEVLESRASFSKYIFRLHNLINNMLKKKKNNLTFSDIRERYEHFRSRCTKSNNNNNNNLRPQSTKIRKKEKGCTESLHGKKSKCIIHIVPQSDKRNTFQINKQCLKTRKKKY